MYPRNAASPEPIAIGTVLLTADGTVQTSGVTVRIKPVGVAEADGAGTVSYSTDGVVFYTPTQSETNYTSFILIAKKTSCIPVAITVVTSASATAGQVRLEGVTHTSAVIPTVTTVTNKTGYELSGTGVTAVQSGLATQTSVDDIPTVSEFNARTLPNADYFVVGDYTAPPTANAIADQVWDEAQADHLTAGSMGKWINDIALYGSAVFSAMEIDGFVYRFTANALELSPTGGSAPTAAAIADAVWDEVISGHLTSGSTGAALNAAGGSGDPWSSSLPGAYVAGQAGKMLADINGKAALITSGSVQFTSMVNTDGYIDGDIIIGDDYLAANGRAFQWTFTPNSGFVAATSSCKFGGSNASGTSTWLVTGTVTDNGNGTWTISFDLPLATTSTLLEGMHDWSAECVSAGGIEITKNRSGKKVKVVRKWTN
jgi:hypothetical protein